METWLRGALGARGSGGLRLLPLLERRGGTHRSVRLEGAALWDTKPTQEFTLLSLQLKNLPVWVSCEDACL